MIRRTWSIKNKKEKGLRFYEMQQFSPLSKTGFSYIISSSNEVSWMMLEEPLLVASVGRRRLASRIFRVLLLLVPWMIGGLGLGLGSSACQKK